jgi:hypothetical protein
MSIGNIILLAAWIISFGLLGLVVFCYAQAEAAEQKLANEWALSRCEMKRQLRRLDQLPRS